MDWLNIHIPSVVRSPEFIGSEPVDRSTHIMLLAFCALAENGGVICGCRGWKDRKWQQLAAVTHAEVRRECDLWRWSGDDLIVMHYPVEKEREVRMKREIAKENGIKSGGRPRKGEKTNVGYLEKPTSVISVKAEGEGEGERKEKGKEATAAALAERLCLAHPSKALTQPALLAALATLRKHPFEKVMAGTVAYAVAVAEWTPAERVQFVKNPEAFFRDDIWNQPAENWKSRTEARRTNGANGSHVRDIDVGGRRPAGVMTAHLD